ncbi:MAG: phosphatidylglycerophosphatase A family protein [Pseudomonadota bacterium]
MEHYITAFATGFGLGNAPWLPGTAGALPGLFIAWILAHQRQWVQISAVLALVAVAIPVCDIASSTLGGKDDSRIIADEFLLFPAAVVAHRIVRNPLVLLGAFAASRALDGLKPPPAAQLEGTAGGVGIVLDDLVANLYLWLILAAIVAFIRYRIQRRGG